MDAYHSAIARIAERGGIAAVLGAIDSGKTTFAKACAEVAVRLGRTVAYVDADVGQSTVGPPGTIGLKHIATIEDLAPESLARADALYFVGSTSPQGHMLPMVIGATRLAGQAQQSGAHLVIVDTDGFIGGMSGTVLKFHMVEALHADHVIGFQRGSELEPTLGAIRRALSPEVEALPVVDRVQPRTVEERAAHRQERLRACFEPPLHRWKVKPSVLVPGIPPEIDPAVLDGLLVGLEDGKGACIGLGILEYRDGLRMVTTLAEGAKALRLGSVRVGPDYLPHPVDLRDLFLSD